MLRLHIPSHPTMPAIIMPFTDRFNNQVFFASPDKAIWADRFLFDDWGGEEFHLDGFINKMNGLKIHISLISL